MSEIFLALDFPTWEEAKQFLEANELQGVPVKVGMELFYREGMNVIEQLKQNNHAIFLDLKLHDIPTTVERAMRNLAKLEVDYVNVHALGGSAMIERAKEALVQEKTSTHETKLLAVTILTSMDETMLQTDLRLPGTVEENVIHLATLAENSGADGVVCSVHEVEKIYEHCSPNFVTMTPGIRLQESNVDDQRRVATPFVAREKGARAIVIGRSITKATNPKQAYEQARKEWENGTF